MNIIDSELLRVKITVDLKKLRRFSRDIGILHKLEDSSNYEALVELKMRLSDFHKFETNLSNILIKHIPTKKRKTFSIDIEQQKHDCLFIFQYLQGLSMNQFSSPDTSESFKTFSALTDIMEQVDNIRESDRLKIIIIKPVGDNVNLLLPKTPDIKGLLNKINESVVNHYYDNATSISLKFYLGDAYKEDVTKEVMIAAKKEIGNRIQPEPLSMLAYYTYVMLPYLLTLPQFPPSKKANSLFSEDQGRFILQYLQLFGLDKQTFKISLTDKDPEISTKSLRKLLERFLRDYIN